MHVCYLRCKELIVVSDHKPLLEILNDKDTSNNDCVQSYSIEVDFNYSLSKE